MEGLGGCFTERDLLFIILAWGAGLPRCRIPSLPISWNAGAYVTEAEPQVDCSAGYPECERKFASQPQHGENDRKGDTKGPDE
jgi:hypothetical protein